MDSNRLPPSEYGDPDPARSRRGDGVLPPVISPSTRALEASMGTSLTHDDVPLRSPRALLALNAVLNDSVLVDALVRNWDTWSALVAAPRNELAWRAGPWAAQLRLPPACPPLPDLGVARPLSRYLPGYPASLARRSDAPAVLMLRGALPTGAVAVGGSRYPSPRALGIARSAGSILARSHTPMVISAEDPLGRAAAEKALELGGVVLVVVASEIGRTGRHELLISKAVLHGGGAISEMLPGQEPSTERAVAAEKLVAALCFTLLVPEVVAHATQGTPLVRACIEAQRLLLVASPDPLGPPPAVHALGALTSASRFSPSLFGLSPRLAERLRANLPAADAVIDSDHSLELALAAVARYWEESSQHALAQAQAAAAVSPGWGPLAELPEAVPAPAALVALSPPR